MLSYLILVLCYFTASTFCFNSNIKISDLEECEELFLNSSSVKDVYPISCLWNNEANENEVLRMRFFVLGFDVHIRLGKGDDFTKEHVGIYISGNRNDPSRELESAICRVTPRLWSIIELAKTPNLTDNFFYTEFLLIVTKDGWIHLHKNQEETSFLSKNVADLLPPTHLGFDISGHIKHSRLFIDCPFSIQKLENRNSLCNSI